MLACGHVYGWLSWLLIGKRRPTRNGNIFSWTGPWTVWEESKVADHGAASKDELVLFTVAVQWLAVLSYLHWWTYVRIVCQGERVSSPLSTLHFGQGYFIMAQKVERAPACSITGLRRMSSVALFEDIWKRFLSYSKNTTFIGHRSAINDANSVKYLEDVNEVFLCEAGCYVLIIRFSLSVSYIKVLSLSCFKLDLRSFLLHPYYPF